MPEIERITIAQTGLRLNENDELPPPGSLRACKNISLQKRGVYSSRRGFQWIINPLRLNATAWQAQELKDMMPFHEGLLIFTDEGVYYTDNNFSTTPLNLSELSRLGDYNGDGVFFEQDGLYYQEASLMRKVVVSDATEQPIAPVQATIHKPAAPVATLDPTDGWLPDNEAVAYRVSWTRTSADGLTYRSAPSERLLVKNTSGAAVAPQLTITAPPNATAGDKLEIYRSETAPITDGIVEAAGDDMFLIAELDYSVSSTHSDTRALRGSTALYTNSTQESIINANDIPPIANVRYSAYNGMTVYGDVTERAVAIFDLAENFTAGQSFTLTVGTTNLVFTAQQTASAPQFAIVTAELAATLANLAQVINTNATAKQSVVAYALESGGRASLGIQALTSTSFSVASTNNAFTPALSTIQTYKTRRRKNSLYFSKAYQPVSVPFARVLDIGKETAAILVMQESRGDLYVFKTDGIFKVSGTVYEELTVRKIGTDIIAGPRALSTYDNDLYAVCNTGVNRIVYEDVSDISHDITPIVKAKSVLNNFDISALFVDEVERQLCVAFVDNETSSSLSNLLVFNFDTQQWTAWEFAFTRVQVFRNKLLFLQQDGLYWQKKTNTSSDYSDIDARYTLAFEKLSSGTAITRDCLLLRNGYDIIGIALLGNFTGTDDYKIRIGGVSYNLIFGSSETSFNFNGTTITAPFTIFEFSAVINLADYVLAAADSTEKVARLYKTLDREIHYHNIHAAGPTILKLLSHIQFVFNNTDTNDLEFGLETDTSALEWYPIDIKRAGLGYGEDVWGISAWGGSSEGKSYAKLSIPRAKRRHYHLGLKLRDSELDKSIELLAFSLSYMSIPQEQEV